MSRTLYKTFFEKQNEQWWYSQCHQSPFNIVYKDKTLHLHCADCGKLSVQIAIQEPLWEPEFKYEATFRHKDGKFHMLFLPCHVRDAEESEEWWEEEQRQKYRMVFIPRSREGVEKLTGFMDYLA